jgi:sulfate permease, SulP family
MSSLSSNGNGNGNGNGAGSWQKRLMPFMSWVPHVNGVTLNADFWAALTGALVVLPQGIAYATIAGMPPVYGLYAGMIPAIVAALFGSSWQLVSGPTVAGSLVMASALGAMAAHGSAQYVMLALTLTFLVGLIELAMGVFRLGVLVNFISHSVIVGFTAGAGVIIAANQLKNFLALDSMPRGLAFYEVMEYVGKHIGEASWQTAVVGTITVVTAVAVKRFFPKWPYMIAAMLVASAAGYLFNWFAPGCEAVAKGSLKVMSETCPIRTVGELPSSLPPLSAPSFSLETWSSLSSVMLAMTLFALTEAISIARALAIRTGQHIDANQEFIGQGLSNIAGAFFSGYVATGSFNRSALNYSVGARTPIAAILAGLFLMVIVVLVAPFAIYLPKATMAGILFIVAYGLWDSHHIKQIIRTSWSDTAVLAVTFGAALALELDKAIFAGILISLLLYLRQTSHPQIHVRVPDPANAKRKFTDTRPGLPECSQVRIIRIDGSLFFGAVNAFQETLRDYEETAPTVKHLMIVMQPVNFIDVAGTEALVAMAKRYRARGGGLYLIRPKRAVVEVLERGKYMEEIGWENVFQSKTVALQAVYERLDHDICNACTKRVFVECSGAASRETAQGATTTAAKSA